MALFDPVIGRTRAFDEHGRNFYLGTEYDAQRPMGNVGITHIGTTIKARLVGYHDEMAPLLPRALKWIDMALARDERLGGYEGYRRKLHWAKALGTWMLEDEIDEGAWYRARIFEEAWWRNSERPWPMREVVRSGLDDYLAFCAASGLEDEGFAAGIEMCERWTGKKEVELSGTLKLREFGLALCLYAAGERNFDEDRLYKAGRRMLRANLQGEWLGRGQYIRAATWLFVVHQFRRLFDDPSGPPLTPRQVILKAYEDMPKVPRPDFVPQA